MEDTTKAGVILDRLKEGAGAKSDSDLARQLGVGQTSVSNARISGKVPDSWIRKAAEQFNLSADWLLFGAGNMYREGISTDRDTPSADTQTVAVEGTLTLAGMQAIIKMLEEELAKAKDAERAALIEAKEAYKLAYEAARTEAAKAKEATPESAGKGDTLNTA